MGPGFGSLTNLYAWTMDVHNGWLYVGTCDFGGLVMDIVDEVAPGGVSPANQWLLNLFLGQPGFDLWKTNDGIRWEAVSQDGFGEDDNYGIRNMKSTPWGHVIGVANPIDGFEIWIGEDE
jgi:hypothetical protein